MTDYNLKNISSRFRQWNILTKLIAINIVVFLLMNVLSVFAVLFKIQSIDLMQYLAVSANLTTLEYHPWTLFTYMFVHADFLHILFNMIVLYGFGGIFITFFSYKNMASLYILGGLIGGLFFILAFNSIPLYLNFRSSPLVGASAGVMAIIFASAFYRPELEINLFFIFRIKIIYVALLIFVIDFIDLKGSNPGGSVAHLGGAIVGFVFAKQYLKGRDITAWIHKPIDWIVNLYKPKPKMKIKYKRQETDYQYNERKNNETTEIDKILDKLKESGYNSLSKDEKKQLFDASNKK